MPPLLYLVLAAFLAGLTLGGTMAYKWERNAWDASLTQQASKALETVTKQDANTAAISTTYQKTKAAAHAKTKGVDHAVSQYRDTRHAQCVLPVSFERLYDSAIGVPPAAPAPSGVDAEKDSGLTPVAVLSERAAIGATCRDTTDQLNTLIDWVHSSIAIQQGVSP